MKITSISLALAATVMLSGCARMKIASTAEPDYAFSRIQTYQWAEAPRSILARDDIYLSIDMQKALNNELAARGWKQVIDQTNATVKAIYYFELESHEEYTEPVTDRETEFAGGIVYDRERGNWDYEERPPDRLTYTIEEATLNFMIVDTTSGQTAWNGTLKTKINRALPEEERLELFRRMARKLTEQIP